MRNDGATLTIRVASTHTRAPAATHLSCWRTSPTAPRNRSTSDPTAAANPISRNVRLKLLTCSRRSSEPATPKGFGRAFTSAPGARAMLAAPSAALATTNHPTGRQRGEGRRPSGTRSSASVKSAPATRPIQEPSHAAAVPSPGSQAVSGRAAASPYPIAEPSQAAMTPYAPTIQPKGDSGRRLATSAPAVDRATNASVYTTRSTAPPELATVLSQSATAHTSRDTPQIDHARRPATRRLIR